MVAFNQIPNGLRVPFVAVEFDNSRASQGPSIQPFKVLILGQKLGTGTADELTLQSITSAAQAITSFGRGSMLARMCEKYLTNNSATEMQAMAIDDAGAAVQATGKITIPASTATADGTLSLYIGGQAVQVAVSNGDDQDAVAAAIVAQISAQPDLPVTAAVNGVNSNEADLTAKHGGEAAGLIDIRLNYNTGEELPAGISATITAMSGGSTNPDISEIIAALPEDQFNIIIHPWLDATNLTALENELSDRFGPLRQNDGVAIAVSFDTFSNLQTLGNGRNSALSSIVGVAKSAPNPAYEHAAALAGPVALAAQIDPARPFQTLSYQGVLAPESSEQFILTERNILLTDGIATTRFDDDGTARVERLITTYQTNAAGSPDISFLDLNTLFTLAYIRHDFIVAFASQFPRHKLANDGTRFGPGQPIMTPKVAKGFATQKFAQWEQLGLVENFEQFKNDLVVERSATDPNRLEFLMSPDLINQLRVAAAQIAFLL